MMALTWSHLIMLFIKQRNSPVIMDSHVFVCGCGGESGLPKGGFLPPAASGRPLCSSARAGQAGE